MAQRIEPADSRDDFPTPPWATRALLEHGIGDKAMLARMSCLEPACGAGHMSKVLAECFGEVVSSDIFSSPTITNVATQAGFIMGTAAYMSPEQAKGWPADRRADIWGFGCVLFQMLTGKMAFSGQSVTDTFAEMIKAEPDRDLLPANTPRPIRTLLLRCLDKDRNSGYRQ